MPLQTVYARFKLDKRGFGTLTLRTTAPFDLMTTTRRIGTRSLRAVLAVLALALTGLALGAAPAAAAPPCWKTVLNDWFVDGRIDGSYPIACYTQAQQHLGEDAVNYSGAPGDIQRALLAAIRQDRGSGSRGDPPGGATGGSSSSGSSGGSSSSGGASASSGGSDSTTTKSKGPIQRAIDWIGPSNAESIPLPLLVLAGIALLLLAAAAASFIARRVQSRRLPPAPDGPDRP